MGHREGERGLNCCRQYFGRIGTMEQIVGIGVDEVERERVLRACEKETFTRRCYSEEERLLLEKKSTSAATNFAGKEAVAKALGTGFTCLSLTEIEILRQESGMPYVRLSGKAKEIADKLGITNIHISLSDSKNMAIAFAVAVAAG